MPVKVAKFGGSSLATAPQFEKVASIVKSDPEIHYVVPSAPGKAPEFPDKITDMLYTCAYSYNTHACEEVFAQIEKRYLSIIRDLQLDLDLNPYLHTVLRNIKAGYGDHYAASRGEYLNGLLLADYLGYDFLDPEAFVFFGPDGAFDSERTNDALHSVLTSLGRAVIPGFYGSMPNDTIRTFSRGGSDITGSIVARAVDADLYENWTDVDGFLMADPRIVQNPRVMESVTYHELRELSYMGATVLHEDSVLPVRMAGIPILIKNTCNPSAPGTLILPRRDSEPALPITGIAGRKGFSALTVEKDMMNGELGFCRKILQVLEENDVNFEHMPTGIDGVTVVAPTTQLAGKRMSILSNICRKAKPECAYFEDHIALIAVVGNGVNNQRFSGSSPISTVFSALSDANIPVLLTNRSLAENNIIVGVNENRFEDAIRAIYSSFVK